MYSIFKLFQVFLLTLLLLTAVSAYSQTSFDDWMDKSILLADEDDLEGAVNALKEALKINPKSTDALGELAILYRDLDDDNSAIETYKKILAIDPKNYTGISGYISVLEDVGKPLPVDLLKANYDLNPSDVASSIKLIKGIEEEGVKKHQKLYLQVLKKATQNPSAPAELFKKYKAASAAGPVAAADDKPDKEAAAKAAAEAKKAEAAEKAEAEALKKAEAKAEKERIDKEKAEAKAEKERLAKEKAEAAALKKAEEKAEKERLAKEKAEADKLKKAEEKAEKERIAKEKAEAKAEKDRLAKEKAEADKLKKAEEKAEKERIAKEKAEAAKLKKAEEKAEKERVAKEKAEAAAIKKAEEKAEKERIAKEKAEAAALKKAEEKAERERLAKEKAEADALKKAEAKAERERIAKEKAEAKAERERIAKEKAEALALKKAEEKAERERIAKEKAEALALKKAEEKAERERIAKEKAEKLRLEKIAKARKDSIARAEKARKDSIARAERIRKAEEKKEKARLARLEKARKDSIARAEKALKDSIAAAERIAKAKEKKEKARLARLEKARKDSIARAEKARKDSIARAERIRKAEEKKEKARLARLEKARKDSIARAEKARKAAEAKAERERIAKEKAEKLRLAKLAKARKDSIALAEKAAKAKARRDSLAAVAEAKKKAREKEMAWQQKIAGILSGSVKSFDSLVVLDEINQSLKKKPAQQKLLELKGLLQFEGGEYEPAVKTLKKVKVKNKRINKAFALSYFQLGSYKTASNFYKKVPSTDLTQRQWEDYALALEKSGAKKSAAAEYENILRKHPKSAPAFTYLMNFYRKPLVKQKLITVLEKYQKQNPKDARVVLELADLYGKTSSTGMQYREKYLKLSPDDQKAELKLARQYEALGKKTEAIKIYMKYAGDFGSDFDYNLKLADLLYKQDQKKESIKYYEIAFRQKSKNVKVLNKLIELYIEHKKIDKMHTAFQNALELSPKSKSRQNQYLAAAEKIGKKKDIKKACEYIQTADSKAHEAQFKLAKIYLEEKNKEQAMVYLKAALATQPGNLKYLKTLPYVITIGENLKENFKYLKLLDGKPDLTASTNLMLAMGFASEKNNLKAGKYFARVLQDKPAFLKGKKEPIMVLYSQKKYKDASTLAEKYLKEKDSKDLEVRKVLVDCYKILGTDKSKLKAALTELVKQGDKSSGNYLALAKMHLASGDTGKAIENGDQWLTGATKYGISKSLSKGYLKKHPRIKKTFLKLLVSPSMKTAGELKGYIAYAEKDYETAAGIFKKMKTPGKDIRKMLALSYFELGDYKAAATQFKMAGQSSLDKSEKDKFVDALVKSGQKKAAVIQFTAILDKDPKNERALNYLIEYYRKPLIKGKLIPLLETFAKNHPTDTRVLLELSGMYAGTSPKAIKYRKEYLKNNPGDKKVEKELAKIYETQGKKKEALEIYTKYAGDFAADYKYNFDLAKKLEAAGQKDKALQFYEKAWGLKSNNLPLALKLAKIYTENNKHTKAGEAYRNALSIKPTDATIQSKYMDHAEKHGKKADLRNVYDFVQSKDPKAHQAQFQLANIYLKEGNKDAALESISKALKTKPQSSDYLEVLSKSVTTDDQINKHFAALKKLETRPGLKPEIKLMLAKGYDNQKKTVQARKFYNQVYADKPELLKGNKRVIQIIYDGKNYKAAAALSEKYLSSVEPGNKEIQNVLVKSYEKTGVTGEKLTRAYETLVGMGGDVQPYRLKLARIKLKSRDTTGAFAEITKWLELNPKVKLVIDRSLLKDKTVKKSLANIIKKPTDVNVSILKGHITYGKKDYQSVVAAFKKVKSPTPQMLKMMALSYYELGNYKSAVLQFKKLDKSKLNQAEHEKYALALTKAKMKNLAAQEYAVIYKKYPKSETALAFLMDFYRKPLVKPKLIPVLEAYLKNKPTDTRVMLELSGFFDKKDPKAIKYRKMYLKNNPGDKKVEKELAPIYEAQGKTDEAIEIYQEYAPDNKTDYAYNNKLAGMLLARGNKSDAIKYYTIAQKIKPKDLKLITKLAGLYLDEKNAANALDQYKRALSITPKDKKLQKKYMDLAEKTVTKADLRGVYDFVQSKDATAHAAQYKMAKIYKAEGNTDDAIKMLLKALKTAPNNKDYQEMLSKIITKDADIKDNFEVIKKLASKPGIDASTKLLMARGYSLNKKSAMAGKFYSQVLNSNPKMLQGKVDPIKVFFVNKDYKTAARLAGKHLETLDPKNKVIREIQIKSLEKTGAPSKEFLKAIYAHEQNGGNIDPWLLKVAGLEITAKESDKAIKHLNAYITSNPKSLKAHNMLLGLVKNDKKYQTNYHVALETMIKLEPKKAHIHQLELGTALTKTGKTHRAKSLLSKASAKYPANAKLFFTLGEIDKKLGEKGAGKSYFKKAYNLKPGNLDYARAYSKSVKSDAEIKSNLRLFQLLDKNSPTINEKIKLAKAYYMNKQYKASAGKWGEVAKLDPGIVNKEPMAVQSYMVSGDYQKGVPVFEQRVRSDSNNLANLDTLALLYNKTGKKSSYITVIKRMVKVDKRYKNYQLTLAEYYEKAGEKDGAIKQYEQWVSRHPKDKKSLQSLLKLAEAKKDTSRLLSTLKMLSQLPKVGTKYKYELAELKYARFSDVEGIQALVKKNPKYNKGKKIMALHYYKNDNYPKLAPFKKFLSLQSRKDGELLEPYALVLSKQKKVALANKAYHDALKFDPKNKKLYKKALAYSVKNKSKYLKQVLKIGYETYPGDEETQLQYARILGHTPEAFKIYEKLLKSDPNNLGAASSGAMTAVKLHKTKQAEKWLVIWTGLERSESKPWLELIKIYEAKKDSTNLSRALTEAVALLPKDAELAFKTGNFFVARKNKRKAIVNFEKAVTLKPASKNYQRAYGLALHADGQSDLAKAALINSINKKVYDEEVNYALYKIYAKEKDEKSARVKLKGLVKKDGSNKYYVFPLVRIEIKRGNFKTVTELLENPVLKPKLTSEMSFNLLKAYMEQKKMSKAGLYGKTLVKKYPNEAKKSLSLAILFYNQKLNSDAEKILLSIVNARPTPEASYYLARIKYGKKEWGDAIKYFKKSDGFKPNALNFMGKSYENVKKYRDAAITYEKYYASEKKPATLITLYKLYKELKNKESIFNTLERLVKSYPKNTDYRVELAKLYLDKGDTKKAIGEFVFIIKKKPRHAKANLYMGMEDAKKRKYVRAIKRLNIGVKEVRDNAEAYQLLGKSYAATKKNSLAYSAYKKSFELAPKNLDVAIAKMKLAESVKKSEARQAYADVLGLDSSNATAGSALAALSYENRDYPVAAALYRHVVKTTRNNKRIWENYGNALLEVKKTREAKKAFEKAVALGAKGLKIRISLARIQMEDGQVNQAEKLLNEVIKKNPKYHQGYIWLAQIALKRNQSGLAQDYLQKALRLKPGDVESSEALGKLFFNSDEHNKVIKLFKPIKGKLSGDAHLMLAESYDEKGRSASAFREYKAVYLKKPTAKVESKLAENYIAKSNYKMALKILEKSKFKSDPNIELGLVKVKIARGEISHAQDMLAGLIRKDKSNSEYHFLHGMTYFKQREYKKAQKSFKKALKYEAYFPEAIYQLGLCELNMNKPSRARPFFEELSGNEKKKWKAKGLIGMAIIFQKEKKYEAAEHHLQKSIKTSRSVEAMARLSSLFLLQKKVNKANLWAMKAKKLDKSHALAIKAGIDVMIAKKQYTKALRLLQDGLKTQPQSCDLLMSFVKVNFAKGYEKPVVSNSKFVIKLCPDLPDPHYYLGMIAHKFFDKKEAKKEFKIFKKMGGDVSMLPKGY